VAGKELVVAKLGVDGGLTTRKACSKIFRVFIGNMRFASVKLTLRFELCSGTISSPFPVCRISPGDRPSPIYELLNKDGLETVVGSVVFYWGSVFTLMLAAYYIPILLVLQKRAEAVMEAQKVPLIDRDQWLQVRGLSVRFTNQVPQVIGILGPLIAAPIGKLLTSLSELAPK
jgi:hypothetical protein